MVLFPHARAAAVVGQCARQFLAPSIARSTPSLIAHVFPQPVISIRPQTRFNSTDAPDTTHTQSQPNAGESQPQSSLSTVTNPGDSSDIPVPAATETQSPSTAAEPLPGKTPSSPGDGSDIPGLAPYKLHHLGQAERDAYHKYGPSYMEHFEPATQKRLRRIARARSKFAARAEKEVGSDWFAAMEAYYNDETLQTQCSARKAAFIESARKWEALKPKEGNMTQAERKELREKNKLQYDAFGSARSTYRLQVVEDKLAYMKAAIEKMQR